MSYMKIKEVGNILGGKEVLLRLGESGEHYVPYEIQMMWFKEAFPNGRIVTSSPEVDPLRVNGFYVCKAEVYLEMQDEIPAAVAYSKKGPKDEIDPYMDVQRSAKSRALFDLGFNKMALGVFGEEKIYPIASPVTEQAPTPKTEEAKEEISSVSEKDALQEEIPAAEEKPRRGRKPKNASEEKTEDAKEGSLASDVSSEKEEQPDLKESAVSTKEAPKEEVPAEKAEEENPFVSEEAPSVEKEESPKEVVTEEIPEQISFSGEEKDLDAQIQEALHTPITYANAGSGRTVRDLMKSEDNKDKSLVKWFSTSQAAMGKFPKECKAICLILKHPESLK